MNLKCANLVINLIAIFPFELLFMSVFLLPVSAPNQSLTVNICFFHRLRFHGSIELQLFLYFPCFGGWVNIHPSRLLEIYELRTVASCPGFWDAHVRSDARMLVLQRLVCPLPNGTLLALKGSSIAPIWDLLPKGVHSLLNPVLCAFEQMPSEGYCPTNAMTKAQQVLKTQIGTSERIGSFHGVRRVHSNKQETLRFTSTRRR